MIKCVYKVACSCCCRRLQRLALRVNCSATVAPHCSGVTAAVRAKLVTVSDEILNIVRVLSNRLSSHAEWVALAVYRGGAGLCAGRRSVLRSGGAGGGGLLPPAGRLPPLTAGTSAGEQRRSGTALSRPSHCVFDRQPEVAICIQSDAALIVRTNNRPGDVSINTRPPPERLHAPPADAGD